MGENPDFEEFCRSCKVTGIICFIALLPALCLENYWIVFSLLSMSFGMWCNYLVMSRNGGRMPVSLKIISLRSILSSSEHCPLVPGTKYKFLGDVISCGTKQKPCAISIGDIFYMAGCISIGFYLLKLLVIFLNKLKSPSASRRRAF